MTSTTTTSAPRELVLASAGTGKTFRISSRILGLLAAGCRPDAILASTFTRKAAGEILDRVMARLADGALDEGAARDLARHAALAGDGAAGWSSDDWMRLLRALVADLHRLNIGTIDAFFVRAATTFAEEVSLPSGWGIADRTTTERVRAEALHVLLKDADPGELIELIRGLEARDAARSVHDSLLRRSEELLALHHSLDSAADEAWGGIDARVGDAPADLDARRLQLAAAFAAAPAPNGNWAKALAALAAALDSGDWEGFIASTLFQNSLGAEPTYYRLPIPDEVLDLLGEAGELARFAIAHRLSLQCRAMGRLTRHLVAAVEEAQRELGAFGFDDVTRRLAGDGALGEWPDLYYRLDARVQHILLDEFQDTSLVQWEALRPLLDRQLSGGTGGEAAVVVADPKQSIYGWRGGEPLLVRHVGDRYSLSADELSKSYRSSQVVLDAVNRVFEGLERNPVFEDDAVARAVAADWSRDFARHTAAKELPGYVWVSTGPQDAGSGEDRPLLCRRAAELVADLRVRAPGRSIGVLTRKNRTVARIMLELRNLGVRASEEGGNPLTDSAAVVAVLSLLRLADHPGDRIARYHVARTPLGELVGLRDHQDGAGARRVAHRLRRHLVENGYGRTLEELAARLADACDARDRRRLAQLAELGFRYDARATLRTTDFVRLVEAEKVGDPTAADVRVMTVHQSKGLEFDLVVLPELDLSLAGGGRPKPLTYRPDPAGGVTRVFPYVNEATRALFPDVPELEGAAEQAAAARWRDALSGLYVALTRARHALYVVVKPDLNGKGERKQSTARTSARLVRCALGLEEPTGEDCVIFESGDPQWFASAAEAEPEAAPGAGDAAGGKVRVRLRPSSGKHRTLTQVSPSSLAGGEKVDLRGFLQLDRRAAEQGTLAHAWFEQIAWVEEGVPPDEELRAIALQVTPTLPADAVESLRVRFRSWLAVPEIRFLLSRNSYAPGATVERELPFFHRADGRLVEGIIDRLVVLRHAGRVVGAEILDYKTDALKQGDPVSLAARASHYQPQLDAYRAAVAHGFGIEPSRVAARLIFLEAAAVVEV